MSAALTVMRCAGTAAGEAAGGKKALAGDEAVQHHPASSLPTLNCPAQGRVGKRQRLGHI